MRTLKDKMRSRLRTASCHHGFTLMELLVVIAIIAMLAGFLLPALRKARIKAMEAKTQTTIASLQMALSMYETDYGVYPQSATSIGTQVNGNSNSASIAGYYNLVKALNVTAGGGPYMEFKKGDLDESDLTKPVLLDPWGRAYVYVNRYYYNTAGSTWRSINTILSGPFHPYNNDPPPPTLTELDKNTYNIYSLGVDGKTFGNVTHTSAVNWNNSALYDDEEDGNDTTTGSFTGDGYNDDDINSW